MNVPGASISSQHESSRSSQGKSYLARQLRSTLSFSLTIGAASRLHMRRPFVKSVAKSAIMRCDLMTSLCIVYAQLNKGDTVKKKGGERMKVSHVTLCRA